MGIVRCTIHPARLLVFIDVNAAPSRILERMPLQPRDALTGFSTGNQDGDRLVWYQAVRQRGRSMSGPRHFIVRALTALGAARPSLDVPCDAPNPRAFRRIECRAYPEPPHAQEVTRRFPRVRQAPLDAGAWRASGLAEV